MGRNSKSKQLQKYLLHMTGMLQDNMIQWAKADEFIGIEHMLRHDQVKAIKELNVAKSREIHDKRVDCIKAVLKILEACPACDHPVEEDESEA